MLYTAGFSSLSHASPLLRVRSDRRAPRREQSLPRKPRSDVTVGSEISVASQTMFAILQMAVTEDDAAETPPGPIASGEQKIWWINHPLMQRDFALDNTIDDCYAEMKRIVDSYAEQLQAATEFDQLRAAIDEHKIKFPMMSGTRELFNIIDIFFDERSRATVSPAE